MPPSGGWSAAGFGVRAGDVGGSAGVLEESSAGVCVVVGVGSAAGVGSVVAAGLEAGEGAAALGNAGPSAAGPAPSVDAAPGGGFSV